MWKIAEVYAIRHVQLWEENEDYLSFFLRAINTVLSDSINSDEQNIAATSTTSTQVYNTLQARYNVVDKSQFVDSRPRILPQDNNDNMIIDEQLLDVRVLAGAARFPRLNKQLDQAHALRKHREHHNINQQQQQEHQQQQSLLRRASMCFADLTLPLFHLFLVTLLPWIVVSQRPRHTTLRR